ncbi:hypothetical protein BASA81_004741 [Batrachochytrium salamandrivorans]|nr:hypothetical protein BASA81_004741 [Batrachochytrium salamandrivorans]
MFLTRSEYDRVEYAREAIKLGSTAIGVVSSEGVVLVVEKRLSSPLIEPNSVEKIVEVDHHMGSAMSGLVADARILIDKARVEAQSHTFAHNETIKVRSIAQQMSDTAMGFGKGDDMPSRPFGVALLLAGVDEEGPQLYHVGPSGSWTQWEAKAIGSGEEGAQAALLEEYKKNLTLDEALKVAMKILKQVMEEKIDDKNVEAATVTKEHGYQVLSKEKVATVIASLV